MRFLSIVKSAENQGPPPQALLDAIAKLTEDSIRNGSLIQTGGLSATSTGARVRVSGGKLTVTDGPFTEAKEVVGGYADRKSTRLNSSHLVISYAVFCLKKKNKEVE